MSVNPTPEEPATHAVGSHRVRIFPSSDPAFRAAVIGSLGPVASWDTGVPHKLELTLRRDYPGVRVIEQVGLAALGEPPCIYVFRDGSLRPQAGDGPGTPRWLGPLVIPQRTVMRNLANRQHSIELVADSVAAVRRSRALREATRLARFSGATRFSAMTSRRFVSPPWGGLRDEALL